MAGASESTRGIRTLPDEGGGLTAAEDVWVTENALLGTPVENETPTGNIDGANKTFTLANTPIAGSVKLYRSGLKLKQDSDFTVSGATITMNDSMEIGENLLCDYRK